VSNSRLVYSTDDGDQRRKQAADPPGRTSASSDGIVRVAREKAGRKGKTVTVIRGLPPADVGSVASDLKRHCGSGGTVKEGAIELQGDNREKAAARLSAQGYEVKLAGG
jgi:translation initiation factor 1